MLPFFLIPLFKHRKGGNLAWNSPGSLGVYANRVMSPTGFNTNSIPFVFAGVIDGPVANKSVFTQPANMTLEYTTNGSTWSTYSLSDELKKSIFLGKGSANTFFAIGGPSATGKTGEKTRLTINGTDRYTGIFGVYIWVSTNGAGNILCDIETSTFGAKTTFSKKVSEALLNGWGGPNYIGFNCTYGGENSDEHVYSIRFTFSCASYVSGKVAQIGEISLMGSTNWGMPYNLGARGHMYDWDTSQNVTFPAGVNASWFSGSGSGLTSINASNLTSGTVPIARIPTGASSSTVALGNHTHSQYATTSHNHSAANITSGTLAAARLPTSGVTAGSYGPTANVTGTDNTTINVPQITVDAYGRVTSVVNRVYTSKDTNTTYSLSSFGITATAAELNKLDGVTTTATQFNYLNTLTGNVQTQLNGKASSSHTHNYAGSSSAGGAATSALQLTNARSINGTSFNGTANITTANWGTARTITIGNTGKSVNGSGNVSWSLSEIGAAASSHTHSYLPLSGGTLTGYTTFHHTNFSSTANPSATVYGSSNIKMETSDGKRCAIFECSKRSSGEYSVTIGASVQTDNGYTPCNISFAAKTSGATSYTVSSAALFRNALGLGNTSGALPVANGGTGTTAKGKTLLSNIGITSGTGSAPSSGTNGCIYIQYS